MTFKSSCQRTLIPALLGLTMLFQGCGEGPQAGLTVEVETPGGRLLPKSILTVTFNDDLIPEDSVWGRWHQGDYLKFDPPVTGRYQWQNTRQFVFTPDGGWPLATDYTVKAGDVLLDMSPEFDRFKGKPTFTLQTEELLIGSAYTYWVQVPGGEKELRVSLMFNTSVDVLDPGCLVFSNGNQSYTHEAVGEVAGTQHNYLIHAEDPAFLEITIPEDCPYVRKQANTRITVTPVEDLKIHNAEAVSDAPEPYFAIFTSQKVLAGAIREFVSIDPQQDFELRETDYGFDLIPSEFRTGTEYYLTCMKGMPGTLFGAVLKEDYGTALAFGEPDPQISFDHPSARYLSSRGSKAVSCLITGIPSVELSVYKVFENNLSGFLENGMRWDYDYVWDDETDDGRYYEYRYYDISGSGQLVHQRNHKNRRPAAKGHEPAAHHGFYRQAGRVQRHLCGPHRRPGTQVPYRLEHRIVVGHRLTGQKGRKRLLRLREPAPFGQAGGQYRNPAHLPAQPGHGIEAHGARRRG